MDESEAGRAKASKELESSVASLRMFGIEPSALKMGQPLDIVSPISGEIVGYDITVGQFMDSESDAPVLIADLEKVWVSAVVKETQVSHVDKGSLVEVALDNDPGTLIPGEIYYVGEIVDPQTRGIEVLVECGNAPRKMKPGMSATVIFHSSPSECILLPSSAVVQLKEGSSVYKKVDERAFSACPVTVESAGADMVRIISGLDPGEEVVSEGGIFLSE